MFCSRTRVLSQSGSIPSRTSTSDLNTLETFINIAMCILFIFTLYILYLTYLTANLPAVDMLYSVLTSCGNILYIYIYIGNLKCYAHKSRSFFENEKFDKFQAVPLVCIQDELNTSEHEMKLISIQIVPVLLSLRMMGHFYTMLTSIVFYLRTCDM